ncbi:putative copper resistance protein D [Pseudonocardia thermophila]|uniref:Putative copper resistance protein D n=1 Tax=Pseudonocardia thermophila TaxID=1848 RepID=A0A1M6VC08_PSETH|nr:CopD family protein [Pseudonocardia thermophila]SHK78989.1 putative copper resistance protein D [Pseudonocardia thermophila]
MPTASPADGARRAGSGRLVVVVGTPVVVAFAASVLAGALAATTVPVLAGTTATRAAMDVAGIACVGAGLVAALVPLGAPGRSYAAERAAVAVHHRIDRVLVVAAAAWLVAVVLGTAFRTADAFGRSPAELTGAELLAWTTRLGAGRGMVLTLGCAAVVLGCALARLRDPALVQVRIPLVAALLGVLTPAVTGHAGSAPSHEIAVVSVALHAGGAALWAGGLVGLLALVAPHRELLAAALPPFSTLAGVCLAAVAASGVVNALVRVDSWAALVTTGYGWLLLTKVAALAAIGVFGALARARLRAGRTPVLRWAGYEVGLMAVAIGLAAALTQSG